MNLLNTAQAAEKLGVSVRRVRALIAEGKLSAHPIGREYAIEESALSAVTTYGKSGRPSKKASGETKPIIHADVPIEVAPAEVEPVTVSPIEIVPVSVEPEIIKPKKKKKKKAGVK